MIDIKKKYQLLKENLANNNLKLKEITSTWALQYIVKGFREDNYIYICELAKIFFNHTSYKRLARKRCKCCKESKKSNAKYNEKCLA